MKVTSTRTIHVELEDTEARELAASLRNAASVIRTEPEGYATMTSSGDYDRLLKLATELTNAPR